MWISRNKWNQMQREIYDLQSKQLEQKIVIEKLTDILKLHRVTDCFLGRGIMLLNDAEYVEYRSKLESASERWRNVNTNSFSKTQHIDTWGII